MLQTPGGLISDKTHHPHTYITTRLVEHENWRRGDGEKHGFYQTDSQEQNMLIAMIINKT